MTHALLNHLSHFTTRYASMCRDVSALWTSTVPEMPDFGPRTGFLRQRSNARAAARLIDDLAEEIEQLPEEDRRRRAWREVVRERLHQFGEQRLGWPGGYRRLLFGEALHEASMAFAREARTFDPQLPLEQLGQALRNAWIGNTLQMLLDRPVEMRPLQPFSSPPRPTMAGVLQGPAAVAPPRDQTLERRSGESRDRPRDSAIARGWLSGEAAIAHSFQLMLGHADIRQTQRYLNVTDEELRKAMTGVWERRRQLRVVSL